MICPRPPQEAYCSNRSVARAVDSGAWRRLWGAEGKGDGNRLPSGCEGLTVLLPLKKKEKKKNHFNKKVHSSVEEVWRGE